MPHHQRVNFRRDMMEAFIIRQGGIWLDDPIITIGDVNGIIEHQNASELSGFSSMVCRAINEKINGMVIGNINCCESVSESTAEPTAANKAPYIK